MPLEAARLTSPSSGPAPEVSASVTCAELLVARLPKASFRRASTAHTLPAFTEVGGSAVISTEMGVLCATVNEFDVTEP